MFKQRLPALLALGLLVCTATVAQTTFGVIRGRVLDPSGAAVPNAKVVVTNTSTNIEKIAAADESGAYQVGYLQPGPYSVSAEAAGFRKFIAKDIPLSAQAVVLVDAKLEVGELSNSVTVTGGAPVINTENAVLSDIKSAEQYLNTPLNVRGNWDSYVFSYMSMVPGAQPTDTGYDISFGGTRSSAGNVTIDGINIKSPLFGGGGIGPAAPSMDFIQEVDVQSSGNSAEFGSPGHVTVVTKGGENTLHGSAFWYYNTAGLNARDFFATRKAFNVMNDFGAHITGPIRQNRTFYSGAFEGFNLHNAAILNLNLPSDRVRKGDFSQVKGANGSPIVIKDPFTGTPFPGGIIPPGQINAVAQKVQARFYPATNYGDPESVAGNYRDVIKQTQRKEQVDVRIDHQISSSNSLFGRFDAMRAPNTPLDGGMPTIGFRIQRRQTRNFLVSDTHIFRPTLINEFRFGLTRGFNPRSGPINGPDIIQQLGLTNLAPNLPQVNAMPTFSISGFQGISEIAYNTPAEIGYQWQDNLTWTHGRHTVKMGTEIVHNYAAMYTVSPQAAFGNISFTGSYSGYSYADFLLGIARSASRTTSGFVRDHRTSTDMAFFLQDDFKVSPRLTVNFGLRYELNPPYVEKEGRSANFDPWTGRLIVPNEGARAQLNSAFAASSVVPIITAAEAGLPESLVFTDKLNFAPRVGFAYKLTSDNKTVVRAAYGIFNDHLASPIWSSLGGGPYAGTASAPPNSITNGVALWQLPAMFPSSLNQSSTASLVGVDPHIRTPYMQQWNFTLEREVGRMGLRASYMGITSQKLVAPRNVNQLLPSTVPFSVSRRPFPKLSSVTYSENADTAFYNGLILSMERKFQNGLQFQASHTWAKNLTNDHVEDEAGSMAENSYNRRAEWGNNAYTRRHRFIFNASYDLPFGKGHHLGANGLLSRLVGGWSLTAFSIFQTGQYFTPSFSSGDPSNTGASGGRPDRIGNGNLDNPTLTKWFDPSAFVAPPANAGRFGNSGVNILRGPGTEVLNMGLFKKIPLTERLQSRLEGTFTNVLNHPNFGVPNSLITSSAAGLIQGSQTVENAGPRTARLGLRFDW
jgi:hypothetical protein